jgi:hypothetical protein
LVERDERVALGAQTIDDPTERQAVLGVRARMHEDDRSGLSRAQYPLDDRIGTLAGPPQRINGPQHGARVPDRAGVSEDTGIDVSVGWAPVGHRRPPDEGAQSCVGRAQIGLARRPRQRLLP